MKILKTVAAALVVVALFCTILPMNRAGRVSGIGSLGNPGDRLALGSNRSGSFQRTGDAPSGLARGQHMRNRNGLKGRGRESFGRQQRPSNQFRSRDKMDAQRHYLDKSYKGHNWRWWRKNNPAYFTRYFPLAFYGAYGYYPPVYYGYYDDYGLGVESDLFDDADDSLNPAPYDGKNSTDECIARCQSLISLSDKECMYSCANQ